MYFSCQMARAFLSCLLRVWMLLTWPQKSLNLTSRFIFLSSSSFLLNMLLFSSPAFALLFFFLFFIPTEEGKCYILFRKIPGLLVLQHRAY